MEQQPGAQQHADGQWYSADGKHRWDGQRWVPTATPQAASPPRAWHRRHRPLVILGAIAVGISVLVVAFAMVADRGREGGLARCVDVSEATVATIAGGADVDGLTLAHARAVRSRDFKQIYFVSARLYLNGEPVGVGTWAINDLDLGSAGAGYIVAMDDRARTATHWGVAGHFGDMTMSDDGAELSRECAAG